MKFKIAHQRIEGSQIKMIDWLWGVGSVYDYKMFCRNNQHNMDLSDVYVLYSNDTGKVVDTFMKGE